MTVCSRCILAQTDSSTASLNKISTKYFSQTEEKINKYSHRLNSKTEKTLSKLARWEKKIQVMLQKASPETAQRLFANKEMTFSGMLEKLQQGQSITTGATAQYNEYRDKLNVSMQYISTQKALLDSNVIKPAVKAAKKMQQLEDDVAESEAAEKFIRERKKELINESVKYIGKSKYLSKINKESYYYAETLKNYKEIFSDPEKTEATAKAVMNKIPAFQKFMEKNSMLATLFGTRDNYSSNASLAGLQTSSSVNSFIQQRLASGGPNAQDMMKQQMQAAQAELNKMKQKLLSDLPSNGEGELPDFKPNEQRSKTFSQRIEYNFNLQFSKNNLLPSTTEIGLGLGYKINEKSSAGIGLSYKLGIGSIRHIKFTHEGVGVRTYVDWKIKRNIFINGGYELNHFSSFKKIAELKDPLDWQRSGLIGIKKKLPIKSKLIKNSQFLLLYDFLFRNHIPVSQPMIFRFGYGL